MRTLVWTRPVEDWSRDQKFMKTDPQVLHFPLTKQVACAAQAPSKPCDLVVMTSRKAAEAFLHIQGIDRDLLPKLEIVTFGMETYKYLLGQKLRTRLIQASNGKEFAEILLSEVKKGSSIWYPRPLETAFPLSEHLRAHGMDVTDIEVYRTEPLKSFDPILVQRLLSGPAVVCFASPSSVRSFVELIRSQDEARFYKYTPVAIGSTTMSSAQSYFQEIHIAQQATLQSLWERAWELARSFT